MARKTKLILILIGVAAIIILFIVEPWAVIFGILFLVGLFVFTRTHERRPRRYDDERDSGDVYVHQRRICPRCHGSGKVGGAPIAGRNTFHYRCPVCKGEGYIWD